MQQLPAKTLDEIIQAIKTVEELKRVHTILLNTGDNMCQSFALSPSESRKFGIDRGSLISVVLEMYKLKINE